MLCCQLDTMFECQVTHALSATTFSSPIYPTLDELYTQTLLKGGLTPKKMLVTWVTETKHIFWKLESQSFLIGSSPLLSSSLEILGGFLLIPSPTTKCKRLNKAPLPLLDAVPAASAAGPATCCGRSVWLIARISWSDCKNMIMNI
jgi:hypothetical protein